MTYFLSPALAKLRDQINAEHPHRDKASDGWIGDASHQARPSDHNPDYSDGGIVRAYDLDEDLVIGMTAVGEAQPLADALVRDPRTRYVIYEGRISYGAHVDGVTHGWQPYTGANAHRHHIHISVRSTGDYDRDEGAWDLPWSAPTPPKQEDDMPLTKAEKQEIADLAARAVIKALESDQIRTPSTLVPELGKTATRDDLLRAAALRTDDIRDIVRKKD